MFNQTKPCWHSSFNRANTVWFGACTHGQLRTAPNRAEYWFQLLCECSIKFLGLGMTAYRKGVTKGQCQTKPTRDLSRPIKTA